MKKEILGIAIALACAQGQAADLSQWVLSSKMQTANTKITDTNIKKWQLNQSFGLTYFANNNFYVGASLALVRQHGYNYRLTGGVQFPTAVITPYAEISYYHPGTTAQRIDYDIGLALAVNDKVTLRAELDNPIKTIESARVGIAYNITKNIAVSSGYTLGLNNKSNGVDLGLNYVL